MASAHRDMRGARAEVAEIIAPFSRGVSWSSDPVRVSYRPLSARVWYFTKIQPRDHVDDEAALLAARRENTIAHPFPLGELLVLYPSWAPTFADRPYLWRMLVALPAGLVVPWPSPEAEAAVARLGWRVRVDVADRAYAKEWEALAPAKSDGDQSPRASWAELTAADREAIAADRET